MVPQRWAPIIMKLGSILFLAVKSLYQMSGMGRALSGHLVRYDLIFSLVSFGI